MACKLRQDKELHGIKLFSKEFKIGHLDDDTTLFLGDKGSIKSACYHDVLNLSGLRLNPSKTKALWLGPWRYSKKKPF